VVNSVPPKLKSFHSLLENNSGDVPDRTVKRTKSYIENELEALEKEQEQIDQQARELEKTLRQVMNAGNKFWIFLNLMLLVAVYKAFGFCVFCRRVGGGKCSYGTMVFSCQ